MLSSVLLRYTDFEYELQLAHTNHKLEPEVEEVCKKYVKGVLILWGLVELNN